MVNLSSLVLLLLPGAAAYGVTKCCPMTADAGSEVKFRPPAKAFGVIWPVLFLFLGASWVAACGKCDYKGLCVGAYLSVVVSLCYWIYMYSCQSKSKEASWVLVLVLATLFASFSQGNDISRVLLSPLIAWAIFAAIMNTTEVQQLRSITEGLLEQAGSEQPARAHSEAGFPGW